MRFRTSTPSRPWMAAMSDRLAEIVPVQLRGIGARSLSPEERRAFPVRIRTRGRLERSLNIREPRALADLVSGLRRDIDGLPLTAMVVWSTAGDGQRAFAEQLAKALTDPLDALWIVAARNAGDAHAAVGGAAVVLDLTEERDRGIYANLVLDLLFVDGGGEADAATIAQFAHRSPLVIVPENVPGLAACGRAAASATIPLLAWNQGNRSLTAPPPNVFWPVMVPARWQENDVDWHTAVAQRLSQIAVQLTPRSDRRIRFRSILKEFITMADGEALVTSLIGFVHATRWPGWAVETLPKRFFPIETADGVVRALTWSLLTRCVAAPIEPLAQLCGGVVFEIFVDEATSRILAELDRTIEKSVQQDRLSGDGIFYVGVASALELYAATIDSPVHAARMREVSGWLESRQG